MPKFKEPHSQEIFRKKRNERRKKNYSQTAKYEPRQWTIEEEKTILLKNMSDRELSEKLSRSVQAIQVKRSKLKKYGLKPKFKKDQIIYIVDYCGAASRSEAYEMEVKIVHVDKKTKTFIAFLYGNTYQRYKFSDYGYLIFDTSEEAKEMVKKIPKSNSVVYQKIGEKVYKKQVVSITGYHINDLYDLMLCLNKGEDVSVKEIGKTIFLNELEARS